MTNELSPGAAAPDFTLPADNDTTVTLSSLRGAPVIVYFYPKDDTPGCTAESCDFRDNYASLRRHGAHVIGISKDSVARHDKFKAKYDLPFILAADEDTAVCARYGAWVEKSMYGKKYMGIDRSTFLIGPDGRIAQVWRKVKVKGHVEEVKTALKALAPDAG